MSSIASTPLAISWVLATFSGYGIYGLQIVQEYLRRGGQQVILPCRPALTKIGGMDGLSPLIERRLAPYLELSFRLTKWRNENPDAILGFRHAVLHGCSSDFTGFPWQEKITGSPNVSCCAIEHLYLSPHGREVSKIYHLYLAISKWNYDFLKSLDLAGPAHLCYQGIDPGLFSPGPRSGLFSDKFVIFSGGKFEFRKGQDIVIAAFKLFRERHRDALLVTCWQNLLTSHALPFQLAGHCQDVPESASEFGIKLAPWMHKQGLDPDSFIDLPFTHNHMMPQVLRDCDVAIFPNRCEGGTNLVAMEAMACGVPTFVSYNTGQKDLVDLIGCGAFRHQKEVKSDPSMSTLQGWGESDVDEVVEALEAVYQRREDARREALKVAETVRRDWAWGPLNSKLLDIVYGHNAESKAA